MKRIGSLMSKSEAAPTLAPLVISYDAPEPSAYEAPKAVKADAAYLQPAYLQNTFFG